SVRVRALTADRKALAVTLTTVRTEVDETLDREGNFTAKIAFDASVLLEDFAQLLHVGFGKIVGLLVRIDSRRLAELLRGRLADSVNVGQRDFDALRPRKVNTSETCHF